MGPIYALISLAITIYIWIILIQVLISWLIAFDVINTKNEQARNLVQLLHKATDPVFKPLQKYVPAIGGIDITPIIVIMALSLLQKYVFGGYGAF
ncbi:MAG: YggT family protein [Bdellovibrionales bacterium]